MKVQQGWCSYQAYLQKTQNDILMLYAEHLGHALSVMRQLTGTSNRA